MSHTVCLCYTIFYMNNHDPVSHLIRELKKLPGVGEKTATRLAFHILGRGTDDAKGLAEAILAVKEKMGLCQICCHITDSTPCKYCLDSKRSPSLICVVEEPADLLAIDKTGEYNGKFHVLHGALSPLDGIGPERLKIRELLARLEHGDVKEIILATNPTAEGEATALYLARVLKPYHLKVSRIGHGVPYGGDLEYIDRVTLSKALENRKEV